MNIKVFQTKQTSLDVKVPIFAKYTEGGNLVKHIYISEDEKAIIVGLPLNKEISDRYYIEFFDKQETETIMMMRFMDFVPSSVEEFLAAVNTVTQAAAVLSDKVIVDNKFIPGEK